MKKLCAAAVLLLLLLSACTAPAWGPAQGEELGTPREISTGNTI